MISSSSPCFTIISDNALFWMKWLMKVVASYLKDTIEVSLSILMHRWVESPTHDNVKCSR